MSATARLLLLVTGVLAEGLPQELRKPHLHLDVYTGNEELSKVFLEVLRTFPDDELTTSLCVVGEDASFHRALASAICSSAIRTGAAMNHLSQTQVAFNLIANHRVAQVEHSEPLSSHICSTLISPNCFSRAIRTSSLKLNSVAYPPDATWREVYVSICRYVGDDSKICADYCAPHCHRSMLTNRHCDMECYTPECQYDLGACFRTLQSNDTKPNCSSGCLPVMLTNSICDPVCNSTSCNFDNGDCLCAVGCTPTMRSNDDCDLACNTTACYYDDNRCLNSTSNGDQGDPGWVKWVIGSLSIVCFLCDPYSLLSIIGYLIYMHLKGQREGQAHAMELAPENGHNRNISDFSVDEQGVFIRVPNSITANLDIDQDVSEAERSLNFRTFQLNGDTIDRFFPETKYEDSLSEFHEKMCTVCLGE